MLNLVPKKTVNRVALFNESGDPRALRDIVQDLNAGLKRNERPDEYGMDVYSGIEVGPKALTHWPEAYHWTACFAVTGGSEGYYVHVEVLGGPEGMDHRRLILLGKCWDKERAIRCAAACTRLLGA